MWITCGDNLFSDNRVELKRLYFRSAVDYDNQIVCLRDHYWKKHFFQVKDNKFKKFFDSQRAFEFIPEYRLLVEFDTKIIYTYRFEDYKLQLVGELNFEHTIISIVAYKHWLIVNHYNFTTILNFKNKSKFTFMRGGYEFGPGHMWNAKSNIYNISFDDLHKLPMNRIILESDLQKIKCLDKREKKLSSYFINEFWMPPSKNEIINLLSHRIPKEIIINIIYPFIKQCELL